MGYRLKAGALALLALAVVSGPVLAQAEAQAQQQQGFDISLTADCMEQAYTFEERQICVGAAARQCMAYLAAPAALARCAAAETAWWDARIARNLARIRQRASPEQAATLARMQSAWQAYRDDICAFEQIFAPDGGDEVSAAECLLWKTGDHAVLLEDYLLEN